MKILNNTAYPPISRCIYYGEISDLRREHILPFGLSGSAVLPRSTCGKCAKITGQTEQTVLRGPMWAVRVYRDLTSRTKHKDAPKTYPLNVIRELNEETVHLTPVNYPILLHFPIFSPPAFLEPQGYTAGICLSGFATVSFGPNPREVAKRLKADFDTHHRISATGELCTNGCEDRLCLRCCRGSAAFHQGGCDCTLSDSRAYGRHWKMGRNDHRARSPSQRATSQDFCNKGSRERIADRRGATLQRFANPELRSNNWRVILNHNKWIPSVAAVAFTPGAAAHGPDDDHLPRPRGPQRRRHPGFRFAKTAAGELFGYRRHDPVSRPRRPGARHAPPRSSGKSRTTPIGWTA